VTQPSVETEHRTPLTKSRILGAAVDLADRGGIEALSMRRLGEELGVEAMALYRHVQNKDALLDGIVEIVVGEIDIPEPTDDWRSALSDLIRAARRVMLRHPWAPRLIVDRPTVGPALLGYLDSVMVILDTGGLSIALSHHALHVMGSRILGFTQDPFDDSPDVRPDPDAAAAMARAMAIDFPNLAVLATAVTHEGGLGGCDDDVEFEFGVELILEGLERRRAAGYR
jgi:AcrR family transcriptional regulator